MDQSHAPDRLEVLASHHNEQTKEGFGIRLISMPLSGTGHSTLSYQSTGLVAESRILLSTLTQVDDPFSDNA